MAIIGITESSLMNSEVFIRLEDALSVKDKAVNLIKTGKHLRNEDIEVAYITVKQITDSLTKEALKAFESGRVQLIYNNESKLSITQAVPFMTFKTKSGYITYIFVDKYITMSRDGALKIEPSILRDLLIAGVIANGIKVNYNNLASNQYLANILMEMYCKFFTRIINREFSIAADKVQYDIIRYWINKFFLNEIFGIIDTEENIEALASAHIKFLDEIQVAMMKAQYKAAEVTSLTSLLNLLRDNSSRMKSLSLSMFLNDWVNYYYAPFMLAVDNIEYLIFMSICLLSGNGNIVNVSASEVVKEAKNIKSYRGELLKLIY